MKKRNEKTTGEINCYYFSKGHEMNIHYNKEIKAVLTTGKA